MHWIKRKTKNDKLRIKDAESHQSNSKLSEIIKFLNCSNFFQSFQIQRCHHPNEGSAHCRRKPFSAFNGRLLEGTHPVCHQQRYVFVLFMFCLFFIDKFYVDCQKGFCFVIFIFTYVICLVILMNFDCFLRKRFSDVVVPWGNVTNDM